MICRLGKLKRKKLLFGFFILCLFFFNMIHKSFAWVKDPWRRVRLLTPVFLGFPGGSDGKESTCYTGDLVSVPGLGRSPGGGHGNLLQYSCLENPQRQRSLAGYSPWGRKELDMTERLNTAHEIYALHYWLLNAYEVMEGSCVECIQLFTLMS